MAPMKKVAKGTYGFILTICSGLFPFFFLPLHPAPYFRQDMGIGSQDFPPGESLRVVPSTPSSSVLFFLAFLSGTFALGCGAVTRHRVLSFFFDGVPPLEGEGGGQQGSQVRKAGSPQSPRRKVPKASLHPPFVKKQCAKCHAGLPRRFKGQKSGISFLTGTPRLVLPLDKLCLKCHQLPSTKYVHGPVAMGRCETCHMPHRSPYPHLLKKGKIRDLCFQCHTKDLFVSMDLHQDKGWILKTCTACHDPHGGSRPDLVHPPGKKPVKLGGGAPGSAPASRPARRKNTPREKRPSSPKGKAGKS